MRRPCSWGGFTRGTRILMLFLAIMLAGNAAGGVASKGRRQLQEKKALMQGDDSECLRGFSESVRQQGKKNQSSTLLVTWNATALRSPCNYTSILKGITCNNSRIASISLPSSDLVGTLPDSLSSCYFLHTLDLSSNSLSGPVPPSLGSLSLLSTLSLSNNSFSGSIPYELTACSYLSSVDLSQNQLSGLIPPQLGFLSLQFFNVSNNKLEGRIPSTLSNTSSGSPRFNASSFANNPNLYGYPLKLTSPYSPYSPPPSSYGYKKSFPTRFIVLVGLLCGFGSMILSSCLVCLWIHWRDYREDYLERTQERDNTQDNTQERHGSEENIGWKEILDRL